MKITVAVTSHEDDGSRTTLEFTEDQWRESEREVLALAAAGLTSAEIAEHQGVSVQTVKNQRDTAYKKLGVSGLDEALEKLGVQRAPREEEALVEVDKGAVEAESIHVVQGTAEAIERALSPEAQAWAEQWVERDAPTVGQRGIDAGPAAHGVTGPPCGTCVHAEVCLIKALHEAADLPGAMASLGLPEGLHLRVTVTCDHHLPRAEDDDRRVASLLAAGATRKRYTAAGAPASSVEADAPARPGAGAAEEADGVRGVDSSDAFVGLGPHGSRVRGQTGSNIPGPSLEPIVARHGDRRGADGRTARQNEVLAAIRKHGGLNVAARAEGWSPGVVSGAVSFMRAQGTLPDDVAALIGRRANGRLPS